VCELNDLALPGLGYVWLATPCGPVVVSRGPSTPVPSRSLSRRKEARWNRPPTGRCRLLSRILLPQRSPETLGTEPGFESASCPAHEGGVRVKPRFEMLAPRAFGQLSVQRRKNPFYAPITDMDTSTPLLRVFGTQSSGFRGEEKPSSTGHLVRWRWRSGG
jgi:hypothetical protein